jgi:hypothetical protein
MKFIFRPHPLRASAKSALCIFVMETSAAALMVFSDSRGYVAIAGALNGVLSMSLESVEDLTPEDYRKRYRETHAEAEAFHRLRVVEAELAFASTLSMADAKRRAAIENAPKVPGHLWNKGAIECGCPVAAASAEAAYRKACDEAEDLLIRTIKRSRETCANEIEAAKRALRESPGWQGWWP